MLRLVPFSFELTQFQRRAVPQWVGATLEDKKRYQVVGRERDSS